MLPATGASGPGAETLAYRPELDGLRALAVLPIVLFHAGFPWLPGGYVGVDIFFVISGYLLGTIVSREIGQGRFSVRRFYLRRARRLLPALLVLLAVTLATGYFLLLPGELLRLAQASASVMLFVPNVYFWETAASYFGLDIATEPLLHTWSLGVEEQFYLLLPALLLLGARLRRPWLLLGGLLVLSYLCNIALMEIDSTFSFYLLPGRAWELLLGVIVGRYAPPFAAGQRGTGLLALAGLLLCVLPMVLLDESSPFPGSNALYPALGAAALLVATNGADTRVGRALAQAPMVAVGRISYSLYLWHWPVVVYLELAQPDEPANRWVTLLLSLGLAGLSYRLVEQRYRRSPAPELTPGGQGRLRELGWGGGALAGLLATVVLLDGLPGRIPANAWEAAGQAARPERYARCEPFAAERGITATVCHLGNPEREPSFALWGDSHANALGPGVHKAASALDSAGLLFFSSGCPALLGVDRTARDSCRVFNREVDRFLQDRPAIGLVYLAGYWAIPMTGSGYDKRFFLIEDDKTAARSPAENARVFARGLGRTIDALGEREVVVVQDVPEVGSRFSKHLSDHFVRRAWLGTDGAPEPVYRRTDEPSELRLTALLAARDDDPGFLRIKPALCSATHCPLRIDG
ncbi:MAG TPA: acyltransferase family protein, partial [Pseudohaliea sp.]|nr:acyltransferase family protein [Pseudohaliea sp.]